VRRVFFFILFKFIEITAIVFIPYFIGSVQIVQTVFEPPCAAVFGTWAVGFAALVSSAIIVLAGGVIVCMVVAMFRKNWEWSGRV